MTPCHHGDPRTVRRTVYASRGILNQRIDYFRRSQTVVQTTRSRASCTSHKESNKFEMVAQCSLHHRNKGKMSIPPTPGLSDSLVQSVFRHPTPLAGFPGPPPRDNPVPPLPPSLFSRVLSHVSQLRPFPLPRRTRPDHSGMFVTFVRDYPMGLLRGEDTGLWSFREGSQFDVGGGRRGGGFQVKDPVLLQHSVRRVPGRRRIPPPVPSFSGRSRDWGSPSDRSRVGLFLRLTESKEGRRGVRASGPVSGGRVTLRNPN